MTYSQEFLRRKLRYCARCCMPSSTQGIDFDSAGICKVCRSSEAKMRINWHERREELDSILREARTDGAANNSYDCIVPISGGKDSAFQLHILKKVYNMNPLAVTHSHNWYSETGWYNLWNILEKLDVDHVMYTPKRSLVNRLARQSLRFIGDSCWHCHAGILSWPLICAKSYNIRLMIFGESPAEFSGRDSFSDQKSVMKRPSQMCSIFTEGSSRIPAESMESEDVLGSELVMYKVPDLEELDSTGIKTVYLGDYIFWDHERQTELMQELYDWKEDIVPGTYKRYKSVECIMPGVHDYAKFLKRGFGRGTDFVSQDVRAGLLTRSDGFDLAYAYDSEKPAGLEYYLSITGYSEEEFFEILKDQASPDLKGD